MLLACFVFRNLCAALQFYFVHNIGLGTVVRNTETAARRRAPVAARLLAVYNVDLISNMSLSFSYHNNIGWSC